MNITIQQHPELYTDHQKAIDVLKIKYPFHIYSELLDQNQIMALKSYLATQNLNTTELHVWSEYNITNTERIRPFLHVQNLHFHVYDPYELAKNTALEGRKDILSLHDHKFYLKSDIFRLLVLYKYGGCFYDHDIVLLNDFAPLFHMEFAYQWGSLTNFQEEGFCASVIGSNIKKSSNIRLMIERVANTQIETINSPTVFGKDLFASVYNELKDFYILPCAFFDTEWENDELFLRVQKGWFSEEIHDDHMFLEAFSWHFHNGTKKSDNVHPLSKMGKLRHLIHQKLNKTVGSDIRFLTAFH